MKTETIEKVNLIKTEGQSITLQIYSELCTDGSVVYNVKLWIFDITADSDIILINSDSTTKRGAMAKYNHLLKALHGFQLA